MTYPKRLIEVDLPIKRISAHARREKSIRHGHISTLHIWWARRPLAACRAVICASLWPDPADSNCPQAFRDAALKHMLAFAKATQADAKLSEICDEGSWQRYMRLAHGLDIDATSLKGQTKLRAYLLDFIADFAAWEASTNHWFLDTARSLTQVAHEALGGEKGTRPLVVDPFAGGGAIPLEALRVGADAFASDLNPVAVLLNKVTLEYIPKYGTKLSDAVHKWGLWVKAQAAKELAECYPQDPDGAFPVAYLWTRTLRCQGPNCRTTIPLMNSFIIANKRKPKVAARFVFDKNGVATGVVEELSAGHAVSGGTVKQGSITCPQCSFTLKADKYRALAQSGALGEQMVAVVIQRPGENGKSYRSVAQRDLDAWEYSLKQIRHHTADDASDIPLIPNEKLGWDEPRRLNVLHYGLDEWGKLFNVRQQLTLVTFGQILRRVSKEATKSGLEPQLITATVTVLGLAVSHISQYNSNVSSWLSDGLVSAFIQSSSIPMRSDYAEVNPLNVGFVGGFSYQLDRLADMFEQQTLVGVGEGSAANRSATETFLPNESVDAVVTDPPYYFAIPYADLSDFFYVWLSSPWRNLAYPLESVTSGR